MLITGSVVSTFFGLGVIRRSPRISEDLRGSQKLMLVSGYVLGLGLCLSPYYLDLVLSITSFDRDLDVVLTFDVVFQLVWLGSRCRCFRSDIMAHCCHAHGGTFDVGLI